MWVLACSGLGGGKAWLRLLKRVETGRLWEASCGGWEVGCGEVGRVVAEVHCLNSGLHHGRLLVLPQIGLGWVRLILHYLNLLLGVDITSRIYIQVGSLLFFSWGQGTSGASELQESTALLGSHCSFR